MGVNEVSNPSVEAFRQLAEVLPPAQRDILMSGLAPAEVALSNRTEDQGILDNLIRWVAIDMYCTRTWTDAHRAADLAVNCQTVLETDEDAEKP